ncbi:MAG: hypothetical protein ABMA64_37515 [Myxococcota bacterium]
MGSWSPALYADDFALDLKALVGAALRLPLDAPSVVELVVSRHQDVASSPSDDEHALFWLVLADSLHRGGVDAPEVFERARALVDGGTDADVMARRGASTTDRAKRAKILLELRDRLRTPPARKPRRTLGGPEPLLFPIGAVLSYPVDRKGQPRNPYAPASEPFAPAGFGVACVVEATRALGYLAVYSVVVARSSSPLLRVDRSALESHEGWALELPGTCPRSHVQRLGLVAVGALELLPEREEALGVHRRWLEPIAIGGVGLSSRLGVHAHREWAARTLGELGHLVARRGGP